ncbi:hypothetical protein [Paenibacillus sp. ATY16]|nr:hypothetical protein [Paenibacillus sp. ATY16]
MYHLLHAGGDVFGMLAIQPASLDSITPLVLPTFVQIEMVRLVP